DVELTAESATDFRGDHAAAVFGNAQHLGDQGAQKMRDLGGGPDGQIFFRGAVIGQNAARFHGGGDQALAGDALLDDDFGFGKGFLGLAAFLVVGEGDVVGPLGMDRGGARGDGFFGIGDGGEGLPIDLDEIDAVGCDVAVGGDDYSDRVADEVDAILSEDGVVGDAKAREGGAAGDGTDRSDVGSGENGDYSWFRERGLYIDGADFGG